MAAFHRNFMFCLTGLLGFPTFSSALTITNNLGLDVAVSMNYTYIGKASSRSCAWSQNVIIPNEVRDAKIEKYFGPYPEKCKPALIEFFWLQHLNRKDVPQRLIPDEDLDEYNSNQCNGIYFSLKSDSDDFNPTKIENDTATITLNKDFGLFEGRNNVLDLIPANDLEDGKLVKHGTISKKGVDCPVYKTSTEFDRKNWGWHIVVNPAYKKPKS